MSIGMVSAILVVFGITLWFDHAQLKTVREGRVLYWCMIAIASALLIWGLFPERRRLPRRIYHRFSRQNHRRPHP